MSETTKEINKVTSTIIGICFRLIIYALAILLIYEGVTQGFQFGYEIFYASSVEEAPGHDKNFTVESGETVRAVGKDLEEEGLTITVHGKGTYVAAANTELLLEEQKKELEADLEMAIQKGRRYGISDEEIRSLFELILEG